MLTNLFVTSVAHAFPDGKGGTIDIKVLASGKDNVEILFSNDSCGLGVGRQAFDPFFTTRRDQGGTGLGLHIVYSIVTNCLGGRLDLDSEPGEGTKIQIILPRVAPTGRVNNAFNPIGGRSQHVLRRLRPSGHSEMHQPYVDYFQLWPICNGFPAHDVPNFASDYESGPPTLRALFAWILSRSFDRLPAHPLDVAWRRADEKIPTCAKASAQLGSSWPCNGSCYPHPFS